MYKIVVTEPAQQDLQGALSYIANQLKNPTAALRLANEFEKQVSALSEMPERYPIVSDGFLASQAIRAFPIKNYIVFYTVHPAAERVSILRFLYGKRNWNAILGIHSEDPEN